MISLCKLRIAVVICILAITVGVLHGMTHVEFYDYYSQFLDDIDELFELIAEYIAYGIAKFGYSKKSDKLKMVTNHWDLMIDRAQPLFNLFARDFRKLIAFTDNLESIRMIKKFLYTYFRQSAINLIDHLKLVYNL